MIKMERSRDNDGKVIIWYWVMISRKLKKFLDEWAKAVEGMIAGDVKRHTQPSLAAVLIFLAIFLIF